MDFVNRVYNNIADTFGGIDASHAIRLVMVVGGYILLRNLAQRELAKRQLEDQIKKSQEKKEEERLKELAPDLNDPEAIEDNTFGWGKKTRKRVKRQQKILEERLEELQQYQGSQDDDKDIEDLLED